MNCLNNYFLKVCLAFNEGLLLAFILQSTDPLREWILAFALDPNLQGALNTAPFVQGDDGEDDDGGGDGLSGSGDGEGD